MSLPFTICFCCCADKVLMLYRYRSPNQNRWNGLGGKIHISESPIECVQREILEEANIDLLRASILRFAGIVTWPVGVDITAKSSGMYAFIAVLPPDWPMWEGNQITREGLLCWKPVEWVCHLQNKEVVSNIPHFLPHMLSEQSPAEYFCNYRGEHFAGLIIRPLSATNALNP